MRVIRKRSPNIRDNLVAAVIFALASGAAALTVSKVSKWVHGDLFSNLILIGYGIAALLVLAWMSRGPIRRVFRTRKPSGDRLAIYVARFKRNKDSSLLRDRIDATINKDFGNTIQVLYADFPPLPAHCENSEGEAAEVAARVRTRLAKTGGDLVIWGKLLDVNQGACTIHFVSPEEDRSRAESFAFRDGMLLEAAFSADLGAAVAARAAAYADFANENAEGEYSVDALATIARRLAPIVDQMPECVRSSDQGRLLHAFGDIHEVIGFQSGENAYLDVAIQSYEKALTFLPRDRHPLDWAYLKSHLGRALKALGYRQRGVETLTKAAEALREALEELKLTRDRSGCARAECTLGDVLGELGAREGSTETIEEGVAAVNRALSMLDPEEEPTSWVRAQTVLGLDLSKLARLDQGTAHLESAIAAYQCALTKCTKEGALLLWGLITVDMAIAFTEWGDRAELPDKMRRAIDEHREALAALEPFPLEWAHAQICLGDAFGWLSKWEDHEERLKEAIAAYELGLKTELTRERDARWWAYAQYNCGLALSRLGGLQTDRMAFERAEIALRQALSVWTSGPENDRAIEALAYVHRCLKERS